MKNIKNNSNGKRRKFLLKGTFNYKGQVYVLYRNAYSEEHAFSLFTNALAKALHLSDPLGIRNYFMTKTTSYTINKEV